MIKIFPSSSFTRSDVNPLPVVGNTITVPTTGPALRLTSGLAVQNRAARKAFVQELITNNSIALATPGVKMVVDADVFLDSSIRSTIIKSKVNIVTSSILSGGEFDVTTSLASDEALYAPLENIGDFIVIKLSSGNKIKFEKISFTEYNVYENYDNNTIPTATLPEGVARIYETLVYVTGSVTGEIRQPNVSILFTPQYNGINGLDVVVGFNKYASDEYNTDFEDIPFAPAPPGGDNNTCFFRLLNSNINTPEYRIQQCLFDGNDFSLSQYYFCCV